VTPRFAAFLLAATLAGALAHSVYRVPMQVSDSLDAMRVAAAAGSSTALFVDTLRVSRTTLRPMRFVQARWLMSAADLLGVTYHAIFRGVHAALIAAVLLVFVAVLRVATWTDFAAAAIPLTIVAGLHTSVAVMREAFPVNHFAEVALCALTALAIARGRPGGARGLLVAMLLAFCLLLNEAAALVWFAIAACAIVRLPGISARTAVVCTLIFAMWVVGRVALGVAAPGIGDHNSGFGDRSFSPDEVRERFAARPLVFRAYNVTGGLASLLLSEPRAGVYRTLAVARGADLHPVLVIHVISSLLTSALVLWYAVRRRIWRPQTWHTDEHRVMAVALAVVFANAMLTTSYMKDEILSVGGIFYGVACYIGLRAALQRVAAADGEMPLRVRLVAVSLAVAAPLWAFRAAGAHYELRDVAFRTRNEWVSVLVQQPARPPNGSATATDPARRLAEEAILRRVATPRDLPYWGDRYWVE
jgi:hypothetical protein